MFLVIIRHTMDDVPLQLFLDRKSAFRYARFTSLETLGKTDALTQRKLGMAASTPVCLAIVKFRQGQPHWMKIVRHLDETRPEFLLYSKGFEEGWK